MFSASARATVFFRLPSSPATQSALMASSSLRCSGASRSYHVAGPWRASLTAFRTSSRRLLWLFVFTLGLLALQMNPAVIVWDAAAGVLFVVVQVGRQDHRFGWWLGFGASHADSVAGVSSVTPGVRNRSLDQQPPGDVEERQAASLGLLAEPAHDRVDVGLTPLDALAVHLGSASGA